MNTTSASKILKNRFGQIPNLDQMIEEERRSLKVAELVFNARQEAGLTQKQLAQKIGTSQPVIARIEDADYTGHSLSLLGRIANALDLELSIDLKSRTASQPTASCVTDWSEYALAVAEAVHQAQQLTRSHVVTPAVYKDAASFGAWSHNNLANTNTRFTTARKNSGPDKHPLRIAETA